MTKVIFVDNILSTRLTAVYFHNGDLIIIALKDMLASDAITDDEKIELMSWNIAHEYMHVVLLKYVSKEACDKFDKIAHLFPDATNIKKIAKKLGWRWQI